MNPIRNILRGANSYLKRRGPDIFLSIVPFFPRFSSDQSTRTRMRSAMQLQVECPA